MNQLLASVQYVVEHSDHVTINQDAIERYTSSFTPNPVGHWIKACPFEYRPCVKIEDEIDRWFLADAMAYCFWGYPSKWTIEYEGKPIDGWWALLAAIQREIEAGSPILEANYLANLDIFQARTLFAGKPEIPLFKDRIEDFNQIGRHLNEKYSGRFCNYLSKSPKDATQFIFNLAQEFPTFYDVSTYKGREVLFFKKAQLLAHDLSAYFSKSGYVSLIGLGQLTGEADYKVPAILRRLGILAYDKELSSKIDNRIIIDVGSAEEIEIRAGMLWACHVIVEKLQKRYPTMNALTLDSMLWVASQDKLPSNKPYHLTMTKAY